MNRIEIIGRCGLLFYKSLYIRVQVLVVLLKSSTEVISIYV
jgi:hypothetical protein